MSLPCQLNKAEEYLKKYGDMYLLDGVAYEFIQTSQNLRSRQEKEETERQKKELEQEQRARRLAQRRNQVLGISLVIMSGISSYAWIQQQIAKHNSETLFARQMATEAEAIRTYHLYDRSVLLAVESMKRVQMFRQWREQEWGKLSRNY